MPHKQQKRASGFGRSFCIPHDWTPSFLILLCSCWDTGLMSSTVAVITTLIRSRWDNPTYLQRPNSLSLTVTLFKHLLCNLAPLTFQPRFNHEYFPLSWSTLPKYYLEYTSAIISNGYTSVYKATFSALWKIFIALFKLKMLGVPNSCSLS